MPRRKRGEPRGTASFSGLEIRQLRVFVALVESKRVTAAAGMLGLAQSTVSEALAALERSLGAPLVLRQRGSHGVELTETGRALVPHARKILAAVNDAHVAMAATASRSVANVDIVTNESVSSYLLPNILPGLRRRWPRTRYTVSVATCAGVRDGVAGGAFDVGLLLAEPKTADDAARRPASPIPFTDRRVVLPGVPLVVFASGSHPLVRGVPQGHVGHSALCGYPLFVSDAAGDFHDLVHHFFRRDGGDGPVIEASGSIEGVKKAVFADPRAIGLLPVYAVTDELRTATIVRVNVRPAPPRMRLDALLSRARARHPSVEELLAAIAAMPRS
jgi:DNA-binding transcriptional LysR family regulator